MNTAGTETNHGHDLGLHLPDAGKHVGMQWIADGEHAVGLALQVQHLLPAVVDGARDLALFPLGVLQFAQSAHAVSKERTIGELKTGGHG